MARVQHGEINSSYDIGRVIESLAITKVGETVHDYLVLCPFHRNNYTPSLSVSKQSGTYICFNPSCGATGGIISLVMAVNRMNEFEALRYVMKVAPKKDIAIDIEKNLSATEDFVEFDNSVIERLHESMGGAGFDYMQGRGFTQETLDYFNIGYSLKQNMVTVPIYNHLGVPVGMVGRTIEKKAFKNTTGLPGTKVFFNLQNAKRYSTVIVNEASFDTMMVHQVGFPNVVATLGGYISNFKMDMLNRYFNTLIIATDKDAAGFKLGEQLQDGFIGNTLWATPLFTEKDACAMTNEDLRYAIQNAMSPIEKEMHGIIEKAKSQQ